MDNYFSNVLHSFTIYLAFTSSVFECVFVGKTEANGKIYLHESVLAPKSMLHIHQHDEGRNENGQIVILLANFRQVSITLAFLLIRSRKSPTLLERRTRKKI